MVDDKSVDADEISTQSESEKHSKKQSVTDVKMDVNARKISDENVYMDLPEQPKRQAPVVPTVPSPSKRQQSQSLKARRKAPAPPTKSRSFSGRFLLSLYQKTMESCCHFLPCISSTFFKLLLALFEGASHT